MAEASGIKIQIKNKANVSKNPQSTKGKTIRGILLDKNGLISHTLPNDNAPDNIKNTLTPHLKNVPKKSPTNQLKELNSLLR